MDSALASPLDGKMVSKDDFAGVASLKLSGRIINAVTSLPSQIYKAADGSWNVEPARGNSSLYSACHFLNEHSSWDTHIVGWTGEVVNKSTADQTAITADNIQDDPLYLSGADKADIERKIQHANHSANVHPVWLLRRDQQRWRKYAERCVWPVFHYIQNQPTDGKADTSAWYDYVRFNEAYCNKIKQIYQPGDIIWIHDYYLLLLPQLLRMEFPNAYIGLFLHIPFPSSEYFRCLSKRSELLDGMLGADRIGFQSESFQRHFVSCCSRILGCEVTRDKVVAYGFTTSLFTLPIGIDASKIEADAFTPEVDEKVNALKEVYQGKKIVVGRDRLDTVRGVVQKLEAFEMFLQMYPEWRDKVVLIQVSSPSYGHSAKIEKKVAQLVNHINSEYGNLNFTPVVHYQIRVNKDEYLALLRAADLALITSVRDGMNTTSMEFVACQKKNNSPLILSEFSGTASVFPEAILVNPWDSVGTAKSIDGCLAMSADAKRALETTLHTHVSSNTIQTWTNKFLTELIEFVSNTHTTHYTPPLNRPSLLQHYKQARRRLFLFDYDGTLTPIVKDPEAAIPSQRLHEILGALSDDPNNIIWIISGRDQQFLDKWLGAKNIGLSAEHGCFMKDIGSNEWVNLAATFDMSWQSEVEEVFRDFTNRTPNSHIEKKKVALTWHYRRADPELGNFQAQKCMEVLKRSIATKFDVEIMAGKANIEVRPKFVNKGEIVKRLVLNNHGAKQEAHPVVKHNYDLPVDGLPDFILCLGDDLTDEDMFRSLKEIEAKWIAREVAQNQFGGYGVYPVAVGSASKQTIAKAHLNDPGQVLETLGLLTGHVSLFESAGTVDLDDRGHVENSESSKRSKDANKAAQKTRSS